VIKPTKDEQVAALETCPELVCVPDPLSAVKDRRVGSARHTQRPRLYVVTAPKAYEILRRDLVRNVPQCVEFCDVGDALSLKRRSRGFSVPFDWLRVSVRPFFNTTA
jgi:hypothetical protein